MTTLTGFIKDTVLTEKKTKAGNINYFQTVMVELDDERKKIDLRLTDNVPLAPGAYELDLMPMIDVMESFGQRRLIFKDFTAPQLRPIKRQVDMKPI